MNHSHRRLTEDGNDRLGGNEHAPFAFDLNIIKRVFHCHFKVGGREFYRGARDAEADILENGFDIPGICDTGDGLYRTMKSVTTTAEFHGHIPPDT